MAELVHDAIPHQWQFFRAGGFDQVLLETAADLMALDQLDLKLWSALSCPVAGLEFDRRTLELIDSDGDGHIRVPEVIAAVCWAAGCLRTPELIASGRDSLPLAVLDEASPDGGRIAAAARTMLANLGRPDDTAISLDDARSSEETMNSSRFNGDGVVTPAASDDEGLAAWFGDIMACCGSVVDRSGEEGIDGEILGRFDAEVTAWLAWHENCPAGGAGRLPETGREGVLELWDRLRPKIDDYFLRCSLAVYDGRAAVIMNASDECLAALAPRDLNGARDELAALPLAGVAAAGVLDLGSGINPAWQDEVGRFREGVVAPLLGERERLDAAGWAQLKQVVQEYQAWWEERPAGAVAGLGEERLRRWGADRAAERIGELLAADLALQPAFEAMVEVERLLRYCRDLLALANNFVSFRDFYRGSGKAIFQCGTLYLDGRSFDLCIPVADVARHAVLANLSRLYLTYCDCSRAGGAERMTIAAAITNGSADQLLVGRNGVFYDRQGRDWDATIVRIIEHPISIRQAFWDPYKRIGKLVGEQVQKLAAARSKAAEEKAAAGLLQAGQKKDEKSPPPAFDAGKFAGIFAAIGLAIGAIGTAVASVMTGFLKLPWWQMPLALAGIMLLVSGPSVIIAWFKLRQRNLGRLLDANGWAVNTRATINIPFGASLTGMAALPPGASRSLLDPFAEKRHHLHWWLIACLLGAILICWKVGVLAVR